MAQRKRMTVIQLTTLQALVELYDYHSRPIKLTELKNSMECSYDAILHRVHQLRLMGLIHEPKLYNEWAPINSSVAHDILVEYGWVPV